MNLIKPPKIDSDDFYEQSKFRLAWNLCIATILLISLLTIVNLGNQNYWIYPNLAAIIVSLIGYFVLKITKNYFLICLISSIGFLVIISLTFFNVNGVIHLTTPLWMIMNILFTFFTLEKKWGLTILVCHFLVLFAYLLTDFRWNIDHLLPITNIDIINYIVEYSILATGISYLLIQFIKTNSLAANQLKYSNDALMNQNQIISTQNMEKEIMLKEIHHRVKNNLQVITSLLRLQSYELEEDKQKIVFNDAINRVKSIALIHEKMYQSDSLSNFDVENYVQSLSDGLIETMSYERPIKIEVNAKIESLGSKSIVPLSLLFNELISNSIKHAFCDIKDPKIRLEISESDSPDYFQFSYHDNGKWKPTTNKSFGKELIAAMTEQLEGTIDFEFNDTGTSYFLKLKKLND